MQGFNLTEFHIESIQNEYDYLLSTGIMWECFPWLSGKWDTDKKWFIDFMKGKYEK